MKNFGEFLKKLEKICEQNIIILSDRSEMTDNLSVLIILLWIIISFLMPFIINNN
jgi:hypothetical protein